MIKSLEKAPSNELMDNSRPTGWEAVAAMANKYPKKNETAESEEPSKFTEMKNLEEIHACEIDMVAKNPDILDYNIDSKLIIWPEIRSQATKAVFRA